MTHDFKAAYATIDFLGCNVNDAERSARKEALRIMTEVQEGRVKIVPVDPTEEMCFAGTGFAENCVRAGGWYEAGMELSRDVYKAMLAAAPDHIADASKVVAQGWQPIETAPRDTELLLYCPDRGLANPERVEIGYHKNTRAGTMHSWATHWMPIPAAPDHIPDTTKCEGKAGAA